MDVYTCVMNEHAFAKAQHERPLVTPCLCANLRRASRAVTRIYEEEFRGAGFTGATQFHVLKSVNKAGSIRQQDLSGLLDLDETTVARTVKPLFEKGWLRQEQGKDRREKWIALTDAGGKQLERSKPAWERAQARMRNALPKGTWESLMESLPKVAELSAGA